jgi:hypothetical protein
MVSRDIAQSNDDPNGKFVVATKKSHNTSPTIHAATTVINSCEIERLHMPTMSGQT